MAVLNSREGGKDKNVKARKSRSKKAIKLVEEIMSDPKEREIIEAKAMAKYNYNSAMEYTKETGRKSGIEERKNKNCKENEKNENGR